VIAETARQRSDLSEVTVPDEPVVELTQLSGYRADVMADSVRGTNRLRALLGSIVPALKAPPITSTGHRSSWSQTCTPREIRAAGIGGVTTYLTNNKASLVGITKTAAITVSLADEQALALPGEAGTAAW
jgi:hypothetical protein